MSDYYYLEDKNDEWGYIPVLGGDYIRALKTIAQKHGIKVTDSMILKEIFGEKTNSNKIKNKIKRGKLEIT